MRHLNQLHTIDRGDRIGLGIRVIFPIEDLFHAVSAEHLHATGAGFGGAGHQLDRATGEQAAQVHLRMDHVLAPVVPVVPEVGIGVVAGSQSVVGRSDDPVVIVEGHGPHFSIRIFGSQTGNVRQSHGVLGNGETGRGGGRIHGAKAALPFEAISAKAQDNKLDLWCSIEHYCL